MPDRTVDAACVPVGYAKGKGPHDRYRAIDAEFRPLLGIPAGKRIWMRNQGDFLFVAPEEGDTLEFPKSGERAGQPRYTWDDRGDGVRLGTLVPDEPEAGPGGGEAERMNAEAIGRLRATHAE